MTELSDYKRLVEAPRIAKLEADLGSASKALSDWYGKWQRIVDGVLGKRPLCRDCADNDGICPHTDQLPCDTADEIVERFRRLNEENARLRAALTDLRHATYEGRGDDFVTKRGNWLDLLEAAWATSERVLPSNV